MRVLTKFQYNYLLISESLRIMNEVMVLLNPRMLEKETKSIITPTLNEMSRDEPINNEKKARIVEIDTAQPSQKGS